MILHITGQLSSVRVHYKIITVFKNDFEHRKAPNLYILDIQTT